MAQSIEKSKKRNNHQQKEKFGMQISNRGIFILVKTIMKKRRSKKK